MHIERVFFYNNKYQRIAGKIYSRDQSEFPTAAGVIYSHGMFSTKDGYKITRMAEDIVNAGYTLLTFDFSFVGESEGSISELSILQEVDDLHSAYVFFQEYGIKNIHLIGSSMGGTVSLLFSSIKSGICTLTLIAAPIMMDDLFIPDFDSIRENGQTPVNGILINNSFFKEIQRIDIESAINKISIPTLIIHGFLDIVVPPINASALIKALTCEKRIVLIEDGDHNLRRDSDIRIISDNMLDWMKKHNG